MKKLGFGLMRLPLLDPDDAAAVDMEATKKMVDASMANGFTYFDTAAPDHHGRSETVFREAVVERYPRASYTITDQLSLFMIPNETDMPEFFEAQLARLGLDAVDYYLLHDLDAPTCRKAEAFHAFAFLQDLKTQGKVKHIGLSFHDKAALLDAVLTKHPELEYVQLPLNYLDWEDAAAESRTCYEVALRHHKPVIAMEPVKGGSLVNIPAQAQTLFRAIHPDLSLASWAIRFAATPANVMMVLSGMHDAAQMADNISYMKDFAPLNKLEQDAVFRAAAQIRHNRTEETG